VFSTGATDNLIKQKGFLVKHHKYALNADRTSLEGGVNTGDDFNKRSFKYYDPRDLFIVIQQLSWSDMYLQQGIYGNFQIATLNYCTKYEGTGDRAFLRRNDILVANNDLSVMTQQLVEYNNRTHLRLMLPILEVDYLADANNQYFPGTDFVVCDGTIEWLSGGLKPKFTNGKGDILSVVYWTKPYFQVIDTPKCFRAVYTEVRGNPNAPAELTYLPGDAVVKMLWSTRIDFDLPGWSFNVEPQQGMNVK